MRYLSLTLLCDQIIKAIGLILRHKYVQKSKWGYTQALLLFLKVWVKDPATKYPLERSFWKKWDHKKIFFRNFSEKHCVLTFYKIYNIRKTSTSLLKYNTQHKVDLASSHYHDDNLFFLKDCSCLE